MGKAQTAIGSLAVSFVIVVFFTIVSKRQGYQAIAGKNINLRRSNDIQTVVENIELPKEEHPIQYTKKLEDKLVNVSHDKEFFQRFQRYLTSVRAVCPESERLGNLGDGGWDVCLTPPFSLSTGCIVYSFGINNDFSFDDAISQKYNCSVNSYDPSMEVETHRRSAGVMFYKIGLDGTDRTNNGGWKLQTLASIFSDRKHTEAVIDVLKIDIETSEWRSLVAMYEDGSLARVKQLLLEAHVTLLPGALHHYTIIQRLEEMGFRKWKVDLNIFCARPIYGIMFSRCYEMYFINTAFIS